jgi:RNA polymerase sigma-70 factor, ECF subfamily
MYLANIMENTKENISDQEILLSLDGKDIGDFNILVNRYKNRLMNFVFRFVKDFDTSEDIVQETFMRVYRKRHEYKAIANFSTWIFTIAGNLAKSELRRRKRWKFFSIDGFGEEEKTFEIPDSSMEPDRALSINNIEKSLQVAIDSLQAKYKQALILRDVEGMSYQEISEIAGVPVGTVKSRVNRARLKVQKKLKGHTPDDELLER